MILQNLGKIALLCVCFYASLFADASIQVDKMALYPGDTVTFTLSAEGSDVTFPSISSVDEFPILGTSSANSIQMINGNTTRNISRSYTFSPTHNVTIPAFTVTIAGKAYSTEPQKISVLTPKASKSGEPFVLELKADKKSAYVGEPIKLSMVFKQQVGAKADKVEVSELSLKDFWVKKEETLHQNVEGEYVTKEYDYVLFPKKAGDIEIPAIFSRVGTAVKTDMGGGGLDSFFNDSLFAPMQMKWKQVFSNALHVNVKPLPSNTYLYGDFSIEASVDKTSTEPNKPINLILHIKGKGNIDDIVQFNPSINDVAIYADAPKVDASLNKEDYEGEFSEHIALVSDKDFTIPSFELSYFDAKTHTVVTQKTKEIPIHIIGAVATSAPTLEKNKSSEPTVEPATSKEPQKTFSFKPYMNALYAAVGIFFILALGVWFAQTKKARPISHTHALASAIDKAKSDKALFDLLLPYAKKDALIAEILAKLEANLYGGAHHIIDKKELKRLVEERAIG
jgi:hypothetical protein